MPKLHMIYRVPTTEARRAPEALESPYFVSLKPVTGGGDLKRFDQVCILSGENETFNFALLTCGFMASWAEDDDSFH